MKKQCVICGNSFEPRTSDVTCQDAKCRKLRKNAINRRCEKKTVCSPQYKERKRRNRKNYIVQNAEKVREQKRRWERTHREKYLASKKEWERKNIDKSKNYQKKWKERNRQENVYLDLLSLQILVSEKLT